MKTINPHSLIEGNPKKINVTEPLQNLYFEWKELLKTVADKEVDSFDAFVAGYYIGNNIMLHEKYLKLMKEKL